MSLDRNPSIKCNEAWQTGQNYPLCHSACVKSLLYFHSRCDEIHHAMDTALSSQKKSCKHVRRRAAPLMQPLGSCVAQPGQGGTLAGCKVRQCP